MTGIVTITVTHNDAGPLERTMFDDVPFDPGDPPVDPPPGCADPMLWRVARALRDAHQPRPDDFCECKHFWPCPSSLLADEALQTAYDRPIPKPRGGRSFNIGRWTP